MPGIKVRSAAAVKREEAMRSMATEMAKREADQINVRSTDGTDLNNARKKFRNLALWVRQKLATDSNYATLIENAPALTQFHGSYEEVPPVLEYLMATGLVVSDVEMKSRLELLQYYSGVINYECKQLGVHDPLGFAGAWFDEFPGVWDLSNAYMPEDPEAFFNS